MGQRCPIIFKGLRLCRRPLGSFVCSGLLMLPRLVRLLRLLRWLRFLYFKFGFLIILIIVPHKVFGDLCLELLICFIFVMICCNFMFFRGQKYEKALKLNGFKSFLIGPEVLPRSQNPWILVFWE